MLQETSFLHREVGKLLMVTELRHALRKYTFPIPNIDIPPHTKIHEVRH